MTPAIFSLNTQLIYFFYYFYFFVIYAVVFYGKKIHVANHRLVLNVKVYNHYEEQKE